MYINTFKYTPADVDCKLCTEYVKKFGCTACGCPWMAERIEAGVVGYAEVVRQMFPHDKRLMARLEPLIRDFPGMLWKDERHRQRMEGVKIHLGHSKRRDTPAFFAVMFLFTSDEDIYRRAGNCLCRRGAEFDYARLHEISPHDYTLYEDELREKSARLTELDTLLNIDSKAPGRQETIVAKSTRPSVLEGLRRPMPQRAAEKKSKTHEEVR